jgi:lycopene cyclase domain-containing protein
VNFAQLNTIFLVVSALVLATALWRSRSSGAKGNTRTVLVALGLSLVVLLVLTVIFDNVMIASGLFDYAGHTLNGLHVGLAPIEDFAYPLGGALLLPGLWLLFTGRRRS